MLLAVALVAPGVAAAGPRDDAQGLADAIAAFGYPDRAAEIERLVATMSDAEAQALADTGIRDITAGIYKYLGAEDVAISLGAPIGTERPPLNLQSNGTATMQDRSTGLPDGDYPDTLSCPDSPTRSNFQTVFGLYTAFVVAKDVAKIAQHALEAGKFGCLTVVVAIGVGGNPQTVACIVLQIAFAVVDVALEVAFDAIALVDRCDGGIDAAEIEGAYERLAHLHTDLEDHDADIKLDLMTHDVDIKALLADIIQRLARMEDTLNLVKKSQLEIAMNRRLKTRPSVFYEERLDELCDLAQEAVNDLPVVYLIAGQAQDLVDDGVAFKLSDPKRAADECVKAFELATKRSQTLQ
jgi:hypothetical protein